MPRWVYGIHPVEEVLLKKGGECDLLLIKKDNNNKALKRIEALAHKENIRVRFAEPAELSRTCDDGNHQGVAARLPDYRYVDFHDWLEGLKAKSPMPDVLVLDELQDPHNLGAVLRSADCFGIGGVVIGRERSVQVTETVVRTSAGAADWVPVAQAVNTVRALEDLKQAGYWIVGTVVGAETSIYQLKLDFPCVFVMGSEEKGLRQLVRSHCDYLVGLPSVGHVDSLNVSVATGIVLSENFRRKNGL